MTAMQKKLTVSIGIPAYNEEQNIRHLLTALLRQKQDSFVLREIIVVSDGSTDGTEEQVRSVADLRIRLVSLGQNEGIGPAQNKILDTATGDVLVLLDADVLPVGLNFLEDSIAPFSEDKNIGLVGADRVAARSVGVLESFLVYGNELRTQIFKRINNADNVYLCFGTARAFRKSFYRKLRWPRIASEDAYSYLKCQEFGFRFKFAPKAQVLFRLPLTFGDHAKQSNRFRMGRQHLIKRFRSGFVREQYAIPFWLAVSVLLRSMIFHPILTIGYLGITFAARIYKRLRPVDPNLYEIAVSSKRVVI